VYPVSPYHYALGLEKINGLDLESVIHDMSEEQLTQLEKKLRLDLQILHDKAGICHGDIKEDNIMVTVTSYPNDGDTQIPIFIDFSHAMRMKECDTERDWEGWCDRDHDSLSFVFAMEKAYRVSWREMQSMS